MTYLDPHTLDPNLVTEDGTETLTGQKTFSLDVVMATGKGVDFSANTGAAGETSSVLNWYEEGTFTPFLADLTESDSEGQTYLAQYGYYTRIGRLVHFQINLWLSSLGTLTTTEGALICGFPHSANANVGASLAVHVTDALLDSVSRTVSGVLFATDDKIFLFEAGVSTSGPSTLVLADLGPDVALDISGSYIV